MNDRGGSDSTESQYEKCDPKDHAMPIWKALMRVLAELMFRRCFLDVCS